MEAQDGPRRRQERPKTAPTAAKSAPRAAQRGSQSGLGGHLEPTWREKNVKAIMFDSCPPKSDVHAFGGWLSWLLQAKTGLPSRLSKPVVSHLFHPIRPYFGIGSTWTTQNDAWMFGGDGAQGHAVADDDAQQPQRVPSPQVVAAPRQEEGHRPLPPRPRQPDVRRPQQPGIGIGGWD